MSTPSRKIKSQPTGAYRISELVEISGVSREMIKYYLRVGLLPKPRKPRPNLSLYTENHLALIRLILRFQEQTKLSLIEIADVFVAAQHDASAIEIELLSDRFRTGKSDTIIPFDNSTDSSGSLSFPPEFIASLVAAGLLPDDLPLDQDQEQIAGLLWAATRDGVPLSFFAKAREKLLELADLQVKTMLAIPRPGLNFDAVVGSITHVDRIINRWMISEKTGQARAKFRNILDNAETALSSVHDAIYIPSKVFCQRFNIAQELSELRAQLEADPLDTDELRRACRAALLFAQFDLAIDLANAALSINPHDDFSVALKCLAHGMDFKLDEALLCANQLEASGCHHPLATEARLLTLLMQAAKLSGVSDTSDMLKDAAELFREPLSFAATNPADRYEALLLNARANTLFPDAINAEEDTVKNLLGMLASLEDAGPGDLDLPSKGTRYVYQVYACFYLAQLYQDAGEDALAREYFERVIQLDPSSNFGEIAYLKLA